MTQSAPPPRPVMVSGQTSGQSTKDVMAELKRLQAKKLQMKK